jgi:hypothetical protein
VESIDQRLIAIESAMNGLLSIMNAIHLRLHRVEKHLQLVDA